MCPLILIVCWIRPRSNQSQWSDVVRGANRSWQIAKQDLAELVRSLASREHEGLVGGKEQVCAENSGLIRKHLEKIGARRCIEVVNGRLL